MSTKPNQQVNRLSTHSATAHYSDLQPQGERLTTQPERTDGLPPELFERNSLIASTPHDPRISSSTLA